MTQRQSLGLAALANLRHFIGRSQTACVRSNILTSEEKDYFIDKMIALDALVTAMPVTYQQDGMGNAAIVSLHYFTSGSDIYITEKDSEPGPQHQAYGYVIMNGDTDMAEMGYVSIPEILACGAELDFYFTPTTLGSIKSKRAA